MYWFAAAALINYSNLKPHKLPYGCGQKFETGLEGLKSRCLQTCGPSGGSRRKSVPHPSQLLEHREAHIPWQAAVSFQPLLLL